MKHFITIIIIIFKCTLAFSQNDTLILYKDHYLLNGNKYNQTIKGQKQGDWLEYDNSDYVRRIRGHWDGVDIKTGEEIYGNYTINFAYKPMTQDEEILNNIDFTDIYSDTTIITNKIPPKYYYIESTGRYVNGLKDGVWSYFYQNGQVLKEIEYIKGYPKKGFTIFREDGSKRIKIDLLAKDSCMGYRFDKNSELIETRKYNIEEVGQLYK